MSAPKVKSEFSIHEAIVLTGFTKYMLDYLVRENIFAPTEQVRSGRGIRRRYSYEDIVLLRALHKICAQHRKIRQLGATLTQFRQEFGPLTPGQRIHKFLFVVGDELCIRTGAEGAREIRSGQLNLALCVDLSKVSEEVAAGLTIDAETRLASLSTKMARVAEIERQKTWAPIRVRRELQKHAASGAEVAPLQRHRSR